MSRKRSLFRHQYWQNGAVLKELAFRRVFRPEWNWRNYLAKPSKPGKVTILQSIDNYWQNWRKVTISHVTELLDSSGVLVKKRQIPYFPVNIGKTAKMAKVPVFTEESGMSDTVVLSINSGFVIKTVISGPNRCMPKRAYTTVTFIHRKVNNINTRPVHYFLQNPRPKLLKNTRNRQECCQKRSILAQLWLKYGSIRLNMAQYCSIMAKYWPIIDPLLMPWPTQWSVGDSRVPCTVYSVSFWLHLAVFGLNLAVLCLKLAVLGLKIAVLGLKIAVLGLNLAVFGLNLAVFGSI